MFLEQPFDSFSISFILDKPWYFPILKILNDHHLQRGSSVFFEIFEYTSILFEDASLHFEFVDILKYWDLFLSHLHNALVDVLWVVFNIFHIVKLLPWLWKAYENVEFLITKINLRGKVEIDVACAFIS